MQVSTQETYSFTLVYYLIQLSFVIQGHLYAVGGNDGTSSLDRCEKYDPIMNKWSSIANMERPRAGAGLSVLEGYVYVVGL